MILSVDYDARIKGPDHETHLRQLRGGRRSYNAADHGRLDVSQY